LQPLRWIDEDREFHLRTPGDQEDPGSSWFVVGGRTKTRTASTPEKCSEIVVEPFDDGWPEYEETFTDV